MMQASTGMLTAPGLLLKHVAKLRCRLLSQMTVLQELHGQVMSGSASYHERLCEPFDHWQSIFGFLEWQLISLSQQRQSFCCGGFDIQRQAESH